MGFFRFLREIGTAAAARAKGAGRSLKEAATGKRPRRPNRRRPAEVVFRDAPQHRDRIAQRQAQVRPLREGFRPRPQSQSSQKPTFGQRIRQAFSPAPKQTFADRLQQASQSRDAPQKPTFGQRVKGKARKVGIIDQFFARQEMLQRAGRSVGDETKGMSMKERYERLEKTGMLPTRESLEKRGIDDTQANRVREGEREEQDLRDRIVEEEKARSKNTKLIKRTALTLVNLQLGIIAAAKGAEMFATRLTYSREQLRKLNAAYAATLARVEYQKIQLDRDLAARTAGSHQNVSEALMEMRRELQPVRVAWTNALNNIGAGLTRILAFLHDWSERNNWAYRKILEALSKGEKADANLFNEALRALNNNGYFQNYPDEHFRNKHPDDGSRFNRGPRPGAGFQPRGPQRP